MISFYSLLELLLSFQNFVKYLLLIPCDSALIYPLCLVKVWFPKKYVLSMYFWFLGALRPCAPCFRVTDESLSFRTAEESPCTLYV